MPGFDESSARRISRSVLYTERQQGIPSTDANDNYGALQGSSICLVKTGSVLPTGYDGSQAVLGNVIERQADGTDLNIGQVWIKDLNGGSLAASTTYQARMAGTWSQALTVNGIATSTTLGFYLVQRGSGSASNIYEPFRLTGVSGLNLVGLSLDGLRSQIFGSAASMGPQIAQIINMGVQIFGSGVFTTNGSTSFRYIINPFTFQADANYAGSAWTGDIVACGAPTYGGLTQAFFDAFDPLQLVRANGYFCRVILSFGTTVSGSYSKNPYTVIAARKTDTYTTSGIASGIGTGI